MSPDSGKPQVTTPKIGRKPIPGGSSGESTQIGCSHLPSPILQSVLPSKSGVLTLSALQPTCSAYPLYKNFTHPFYNFHLTFFLKMCYNIFRKSWHRQMIMRQRCEKILILQILGGVASFGLAGVRLAVLIVSLLAAVPKHTASERHQCFCKTSYGSPIAFSMGSITTLSRQYLNM